MFATICYRCCINLQDYLALMLVAEVKKVEPEVTFLPEHDVMKAFCVFLSKLPRILNLVTRSR
jgi:hypothetical protein